MKLKCNRKELNEAVQIVGTIAASVTTQPILQDIKISSEGENLEFSATDLEVGVKYFVKEGIEVIDNGSVVVPGVRISNILREWAGEDIEFNVEENICHLRGEGSHFKLVAGTLDMFPSIPDFNEKAEEEGDVEGQTFMVRSETLTEMIKKTTYAVATERINQALNGVLLTVNEDKIRMTATDGRRLARVEQSLEEPVVASRTGVIPVKGLNQLLKVIAAGGGGTVKIRLKETYLLAKTERAIVSCRLIEDKYPDVGEVVPENNDKILELDTDKLLSAVRRASLLLSDECRVIKLRFEAGKLVLSSEATELGEARIELSAPYTGEPFDIGFNPDYIIDALKVVVGEKVTVELKQSDIAGVIKDGRGYISMIMPINLS